MSQEKGVTYGMSNRFISNLVLLKAMALEKDGAKEVLISIS